MIPLARPYIGEEEVEAVSEVLRSGRLSLGPKLQEFEEAFADYVGTRHAVGVSSGTAGLHLCMRALGVGEGDEVVTTPFSFIASANCIVYEGARPVFVDIDEETLNLDPDRVEEAVGERTRALLPVHIFGEPCDMPALMDIARRWEVPVVEDAAEAVGATIGDRKVGTFGIASVFAFYPNKQMTTGEGGMICTDDDRVAELCRSLRNQGRDDKGDWLRHERVGFNYRLDEMSAAVGVEQLKRIDFLLEDRERVAGFYDERLADVEGLVLPARTSHYRSWFVYVVRLPSDVDRARVIRELDDRDIQTKGYLPAIHLQPAYRSFGYEPGMFPVCERVASSTLALPFYTGMTAEEVDTVCEALRGVLED